jgi:hypothetical protein
MSECLLGSVMGLTEDVRYLADEIKREESVPSRSREYHNAVQRLILLAEKAAKTIEDLESCHA